VSRSVPQLEHWQAGLKSLGEVLASHPHSLVNGVLTAAWIMTALVDRFLFIASLLSKKYTAALGVKQTSKDRQEGGRRSCSARGPPEGQEDNNISNLSDEEFTGDIWGPI